MEKKKKQLWVTPFLDEEHGFNHYENKRLHLPVTW